MNVKIINKIKVYDEITSTHLLAKKMGNNNEDEIVIIAKRQTSGIGTHGRKWITGDDKNIAMSVLIYPNCKIDLLGGFTIDIANVIKNTIFDLYEIELKIKEPNDLMLNGKKICGILTEINTIGEKINYLIISCGFNVNQDLFPNEIEKNATSLKKEYNYEFDKEKIIFKILEGIEKLLNKKQIMC